MAGRSFSLGGGPPHVHPDPGLGVFAAVALVCALARFLCRALRCPSSVLCVLDESERLAAGDKRRHPEEVFIFFVVCARD